MSRAAVNAARAAAGINNLSGKLNKTMFGEKKERYVNLCGLKARVGRFWYGENYVFNENHCRSLLEGTDSDSSFKKRVDDMLGPMSKFSIIFGVIDTGLKTVGTVVSAYKKGPKEGSTDILKSVTGIDNKEMAENVRTTMMMVSEIHEKLIKKQSQPVSVSPPPVSVSPPSESHRGGGGGGGADDEGGGAADGGGD